MMHYALIDNISGVTWWAGEAANAPAACMACTLEVFDEEIVYVSTNSLADGEVGFHVYAAPAGYAVRDDDRQAAEVMGMPLVGLYRKQHPGPEDVDVPNRLPASG